MCNLGEDSSYLDIIQFFIERDIDDSDEIKSIMALIRETRLGIEDFFEDNDSL